jgi:hypothetical protein
VDQADVEEIANQGNFILGGSTAPPQMKVEPPPDYSGMTLPELKEAALERGIVVTPEAKKADILQALQR